jgi:carbonic anhydrase
MNLHNTVKNADVLHKMTPSEALKLLKEGNQRFLSKNPVERDHHWHIKQTIDAQHPFAIVLSCIDSRVMPSLIFDQGIGDLFVARIAGNIVNQDILGSMEYACAVTGSKLIVVLGHTSCGAVKGAIDNVRMGNLTAALKPIKLAIAETNIKLKPDNQSSKNLDYVNSVAKENVFLTIDDIKDESPILKDLYDKNQINIIGAMYDHSSGKVDFFD